MASGGYENDISTLLLGVRCVFCGTVLRVPESLERGSGPDCDAKYMGGSGAEAVSSMLEHGFDLEEAVAAVEEAPDIVPERWIEPLSIAKKDQIVQGPDGPVQAEGGEVLTSRPLRPGSLRDYLKKKGKRGRWKKDPQLRLEMFSGGIWYASRAVTFGFGADIVTADKVDPRFLVVAAVQRFARAIGLVSAAEALNSFYASKLVKFTKADLASKAKAAVPRGTRKETQSILFEQNLQPINMPPRYRGQFSESMMRVHAPYSEQFNRLARENRQVFISSMKSGYLFWRYFDRSDLRTVVNLLQEAFGSQMAVLRDSRRPRSGDTIRVVDTWTGKVKILPKRTAEDLLRNQPKTKHKTQLRYQKV